jgi:anti-anti-sigma factor
MEVLEIKTRELEFGIWEVSVAGTLDWTNFSQVEERLGEVFEQKVYRIVVNLAEAKYISSAGFGSFISSLDTATKHGGDIVFTHTPTEIHGVFDILGLTKVLRFADTTEEAVEHLKADVPG